MPSVDRYVSFLSCLDWHFFDQLVSNQYVCQRRLSLRLSTSDWSQYW